MTFDDLIAQGIRDTLEERCAENRVIGKKHRFSLAYRIRRRSTLRSRNNSKPLSIRKINAILIAIILALFVLTGFSLWRQFGDFSFNILNDHSKVSYSGDNFKTTIEEIYGLPEEFELLSITIDDVSVLSQYIVNDEIVTLSQQLISLKGNINTENNPVEYLTINGNEGYYLTFANESDVSWVMDGYRFYISGKIDKNKAISLAESLKFRSFDKIT